MALICPPVLPFTFMSAILQDKTKAHLLSGNPTFRQLSEALCYSANALEYQDILQDGGHSLGHGSCTSWLSTPP